MIKISLLAAFILNFPIFTYSQTINLSGAGWKAWQDTEAQWKNDRLYLPSEISEDLSNLPVNQPTRGWGLLNEVGRNVRVPLTMEEYFSGGINTYTYEGVSWIWREFEVSKDQKGKILHLNVEKSRMRAEIFINEKLAAYDVIGETPYQFDVSKHIRYGENNTIAVRLTNPGGRRGWDDAGFSRALNWGKYMLRSSGADFSTLGNVSIVVHDKVYIDDVFVKNILPVNGKRIRIEVSINNTSAEPVEASIPIVITQLANSGTILKRTLKLTLYPGKNVTSDELTLSKADLWSPKSPVLYNCKVTLKGNGMTDEHIQTFGVRTFQVLQGESGGHNFYLNGERFFLKSAVDWGYYAPSGDYATDQNAKRSVQAAKEMHQNGISFHRKIGEPLVMKYADELGLCIYEEPGGFHKVDSIGFELEQTLEKVRRMVVRDRNHPSLMIYSLSNEDQNWTPARERALKLIHELDNSRLIINSSGIPPELTPHFRPYENIIRTDFRDQHTAGNRGERYVEEDFWQEKHRVDTFMNCIYFLGEVNSTTGPSNWYEVYEDIKANMSTRPGYDSNIYEENHAKIANNFDRWRLGETGSGNINSPEDISEQAGRGMMYIHGRHAQSIMCNNVADGYALNGWSPGPQSEGNMFDWDSGILDEGRFLKGPASSFNYYIRPLQIAITRKNGKYFNAGDTAAFELNLINQGQLQEGDYDFKLSVFDDKNISTSYFEESTIKVKGGDCFSQSLDDVSIILDSSLNAGYITVHASLTKDGNEVADGTEQVLLKNRGSYKSALSNSSFRIYHWNAAHDALSGLGRVDTSDSSASKNINLIGSLAHAVPEKQRVAESKTIKKILNRVDSEGETLIIKFDHYWARILHSYGILSAPVTEWGGKQTSHWFGNGWGYLDYFVGNLSVANRGTIGTNSWEVPSDPTGFYPFECDFPQSVYGLYMARPWLCKTPPVGIRISELQPTMLVLLGVIDYGKGKIILQPCYHIDEDNAFTDMLFYNIICKSASGDW
jgi:beta-galactosidase